MPNVTLHALLAERVLEEWPATDGAPFDPAEEAHRNAFLLGSFGPDLGYFPGGEPFFSDLAHYVRSGDLTRALIDRARSPTEHAFAWGWVTHVLADRAIHPAVGEAVGEHLTGRRRFIRASADLSTHVRVEVGLDAHVSHRHPGLRGRPLRPVFDGATVAYLAEAYRDTYRIPVDATLLLDTQHRAVRMAGHALLTIGTMGTLLARRHRSAAIRGLRRTLAGLLLAVRTGTTDESMILAYVNPLPPRAWLVDAVEETIAGFPRWFGEVWSDRARSLPDWDLDSGETHPGEIRSEVGRRAAARVEAMGGVALGARRFCSGSGDREV